MVKRREIWMARLDPREGTGDLKTLVAELRTACNACHASYLKTQ
jgi:hypothetical protein